jgi:ATP-dependent RNA helicase RhlE
MSELAFSPLGLSEPLAQAAREVGYLAPTSVQREAIPHVLFGGDVWVSAQTGSGKTAAFLLPILDKLVHVPRESPRPVLALVLVPTRELALQIEEVTRTLGRHLPARLKVCALVGGVSENPQMMALRGGADLVIATPGRLLDLVAKNALSLQNLQTLVLDEADRLLSLGFGDELRAIQALIPKPVQTLLFSATFVGAVKVLAEAMLTQPTRIQIEAGAPPVLEQLVQRAFSVNVAQRTLLLRTLIKSEGWAQVLVFVASRHAADLVADKLLRAGLSAAALHGDLTQARRSQALGDFRGKRIAVLVATDVAGRGLDIAELPVVLNYDLPRSPTDYLHRIGRTARAGESGLVVNFVTVENEAHFRLIEKRHRFALVREELPGFERTDVMLVNVDPHGGVKGKRVSKKDKLRMAAKG